MAAVQQYLANACASSTRSSGCRPSRRPRASRAIQESGFPATAAPPPAPRAPVETAPDEAVPLVGRTAELTRLLDSYRGIGNKGRVVVIEGEMGIGKTRLADDFLASLDRGAATTRPLPPGRAGARLRPGRGGGADGRCTSRHSAERHGGRAGAAAPGGRRAVAASARQQGGTDAFLRDPTSGARSGVGRAGLGGRVPRRRPLRRRGLARLPDLPREACARPSDPHALHLAERRGGLEPPPPPAPRGGRPGRLRDGCPPG